MKLEEAVRSFDDWSQPWKFESRVRDLIEDQPEELEKYGAISEEANKRDHWNQFDLVLGCKIAQSSLKDTFPEMDEDILAAFVRSASYNWR